MFGDFWNIFWNIQVLGQSNVIFSFSKKKWCRIIYKFRQNTIFGPETYEIGPKVGNRTCPDLPRPVLLSKFNIFIKSSVLLSKFISFYKIIGFTKRIYQFYEIIGFTKRIYKFTSPYRQTSFLLLKFQGLRFLYFH